MEKPMQAALGVDVGGTKVNVGLVSRSGKVLHSLQFPMRRLPIQEWTLELEAQIGRLLETAPMSIDLLGIGLAFRGIVDFSKQILVSSSLLSLSPDFHICKRLSTDFQTNVLIENDVKAAAIGESLFGAGKRYDSFGCVNIGTGIGMGIILQRTLWRGITGQAGEICTSPFFREDGSLDQLEELVSGSGIVKEIHRQCGSYPASPLGKKEKVTGKELFEGAREGDGLARAALDHLMRTLAIEMLTVESILDLGHYIFFGGVASNAQFLQELERTLSHFCSMGFEWKASIEESELGAREAGLLGAVSLIFGNC